MSLNLRKTVSRIQKAAETLEIKARVRRVARRACTDTSKPFGNDEIDHESGTKETGSKSGDTAESEDRTTGESGELGDDDKGGDDNASASGE